MYRSIVVPLDGSPFSEYALPIACTIAERAGALLQLMHVHALSATPLYREGLPVIDENLMSRSRAHAFAYLEQIKTQLLASQPKLNVVIKALDRSLDSLVNEPLGAYLAEHIAANANDLIVMTTHGRSGLARAWLGSVADTLVRLSHIPILLMRPGEGALNFGQTIELKHFLVPLDGSALAERVMPSTLALGTLMQAECTLLRIVEPLFPIYNAVAHTRELDESSFQAAHRYLVDIAKQYGSETQALTPRVLLAEQPATTIVSYAQQHKIDLIALATHGRSGLPRLWLGSVADKIIRGTTTPVLLYRPQETQD